VNEKTTEAANVPSAPVKPRPVPSILMVEDEIALTSALAPFFTDHGFKLVTATNGVDGLKLIMAEDFAVIICDMMMPSLPGHMFYRAVERTKPHLCPRFLFITGYKGDSEIEDFIRRIGGAILWKPFKTSQLRDAINLIIQKTAPDPRVQRPN
jgi:DNA-binding response OmpR family regulator